MTDGPRAGGATLGLVLLGLVAIAVAGFVGLVGVLFDDRGGETATAEDAIAAFGASSDGYRVWARNDDGTPVRWDPCRPLDLVIHDDLAPSGWRTDLEVALDELREASGMTLRVTADTDESPSLQRDAYQPDRYGERWAPVLVAWARPGDGELPLLATDRGLAIPVAVGPAGDRTYVTGQVVFNADREDLDLGFEDRATSWGATLLHEFGHLLGLAHVQDEGELMATFPGQGPVRFGPGDLAGLSAIGEAAGCRSGPPPRPVEVPVPLSELDLHRKQR